MDTRDKEVINMQFTLIPILAKASICTLIKKYICELE